MRITLTDDELEYVLEKIADNSSLVENIQQQRIKSDSFTKARKERMLNASTSKAETVKLRVFAAIEKLEKKNKKYGTTAIMTVAKCSRGAAIKYREIYKSEKEESIS